MNENSIACQWSFTTSMSWPSLKNKWLSFFIMFNLLAQDFKILFGNFEFLLPFTSSRKVLENIPTEWGRTILWGTHFIGGIMKHWNTGTLKYWVGVQRGQCLISLGWPPFYWWCHNKKTLWGRCFITLTSLALHLFPFAWLKQSNFIVRSVQTVLGRWKLVVAVISVNVCLLLAFSDLICYLEE